jgi:tetratricopeptide (TPR) repeat protein
MTAKRIFLLTLLALMMAAPAAGQLTQIIIPAGSDADKASTAINAETDPQKRIAMLNDFVKQFASDKIAVAFGYQLLAQQYQMTGDMPKAVDAAEQAYAAVPANVDIVTTAVTVTQAAKNNRKTLEYACKGGVLINSIGKDAGSDAAAAERAKFEQQKYQQQYDFFETAAYNAVTGEDNPKERMAYIDQYTAAFPKSKFAQNVMQFAMMSLQQMNQPAKFAEFGEKLLASNPDDMATLVMLANVFAQEQNGAHFAKASEYAHRAIELAKKSPDDKQAQLSAAIAHSSLGAIMMRQEKTLPAIAELKLAEPLLKDDQDAGGMVLYYLGFGYAKLQKLSEAKVALGDCVKLAGAYKGPCQDILAKVNAAKPRAAGK